MVYEIQLNIYSSFILFNRRSKDVQCQAKVKTSTQKHSNTTDKSCSQKHQPFSSTTNAFIALYPYKPHKSDELELKKGCKFLIIRIGSSIY